MVKSNTTKGVDAGVDAGKAGQSFVAGGSGTVTVDISVAVPREAEISLKSHLYYSLDGHIPNGFTFNIYSRGLGLYPGRK